MRVLAMIHAYPPSHNAGAELTIKVMCEALAKRGHQVDVLLNRCSYLLPYTLNGVNVWPLINNGDPFRWFGTDRQPDVVLCHLENTPRASVLGEMHKVPVVHVVHNTHDWTKHCMRRNSPALAVFNTDWMREDYRLWFDQRGLRFPRHITVHPPVFGEDYRVEQSGKCITLINMNGDKGGHLFWELVERLPNREFLGVRGAYGEQVVPPRTEWPGSVQVYEHLPPQRMRDVYKRTRVLLMPSNYESYGRTAVEAACSGIPTIAHPTPGLREALGPDGIFCDREQPDQWVAALRRLWTPKGYAKSRQQALAMAARQSPAEDLDRFCDAVEEARRYGLTPAAR